MSIQSKILTILFFFFFFFLQLGLVYARIDSNNVFTDFYNDMESTVVYRKINRTVVISVGKGSAVTMAIKQCRKGHICKIVTYTIRKLTRVYPDIVSKKTQHYWRYIISFEWIVKNFELKLRLL